MADPISVPIETDPTELAEIAFDYMEANVPGWTRARGDAASQVIQATAQIIAEGTETAADVPFAILRYLGEWVDGLPPIDATAAQTTATVTALDNLGYTLYDGTRFEVKTSGDEGVVFYTVGDVTIAPLSTTTATGEVVLVAETVGAAGSGLPADSEVVPVDALAWIDTVTLEELTTGGVDAETDDEYLTRWITLRQLSNDTPILAVDAAALVLALIPGVGRTLGLDNYDPIAATYGNEKYVTVAATDLAGEPLSAGTKTAAVALLDSKRELNFVMSVIDATYSTIDVSVAFTVYAGFDVDAAEAAVIAALTAYLDPLAWSTSGGTAVEGGSSDWRALTHVYLYEIVAVVNAVEPVDRVTSLTMGRTFATTAVAATDVLTAVDHTYVLNSPVVFAGLAGGAPLVNGTTYYARDPVGDTFKVALTAGGAAVNITTDITAGTVRSFQAADVVLAQPAALTRPGTITAVGT